MLICGDAVARVRAVMDAISARPTSGLGGAEIGARISDLAVARSALESLELEAAARLREFGAGAAQVAGEFVINGGRGAREAGRVNARVDLCEQAPVLGDALGSGAISAAHIDAVELALRKLTEDERGGLFAQMDDLIAEAAVLPVDEFAAHVRAVVAPLQGDGGVSVLERQRRMTELKSWTDDEGMIRLKGRFDPERGVALLGQLNMRVEAMFHAGVRPELAPGVHVNDHLRALALLEMVGGAADSSSSGSRAEVMVVIDWESLRNGVHEHTVSRSGFGVDLPVETVRRMACDAGVLPVVFGARGEVLDVGRARRLATAAQRKALFAMYSTCAIRECQVKFEHCVPHHIDYWEHGGRSDLSNLVPLCSQHHHAAHEGGWKLRMEPGRQLVVTKPAGVRRC